MRRNFDYTPILDSIVGLFLLLGAVWFVVDWFVVEWNKYENRTPDHRYVCPDGYSLVKVSSHWACADDFVPTIIEEYED